MPTQPESSYSNPNGFLSGEGEMKSLIRAFDWSTASVGPTDSWPQSLRTTLSILLNSKFPMFLFWGDDLTCFYNDAYRPSLGNNGKHPSALGQKGEDCWPEIWPVIKPLIDLVLAGGEATWSEDQLIPIYRNEKLEDVYWTFSYSPVIDESEKVGGVLVVCNETTKAVENLQNLEENRNQLQFAIEATELGTWDFNPKTNKFTGNLRIKKWFGLPPENEIELSHAMNVVAEKDRERLANAIQSVLQYESGGQYDIEYTIIHPTTNKERIVRAKGKAWFNNERIAYRFNGTLQDISEQVLSRNAIEENEHLLSNVIQESPVRISFLTGPEMTIKLANDIVIKSWGKGDSVIGKPLKEALPEMISQPFLDILDNVYQTGIPYSSAESKVTFIVDGAPAYYYFDIWYKPIFDIDGKVYGILTSSTDVTEKVLARKKITESENRFRDVVENAPFPIGVYVGKDFKIQLANQVMLNTWGKGDDVIGKSYREILPELENQEIFEQLNEVLDTGIPFHAKNAHVDLFVNGKLSPYYFNYSFTPLYDLSGNIYGIMNTAADVTDLMLANQKVEQSEDNLRNTILQAPVSMCILKGPKHFVEIANERMLELWGKKHHEIVGKQLMDGLEEIKGQGFDLLLDHVYATGETYKAYDVAVKLPRETGIETVYVDFVYEAFRENDGSIAGVLVVATDVTEQLIARMKIEQAEERARLAIESADLGSYEINLVTDHMQTSDRFNDIWGVDHSVPRSEFANRIHPKDREIRAQAHEDALINGNLHYEARVIWADQSEHWVRIKGKVLYDEDGE
ncbi:MAG TPA: PAS domain-containing protein, partial [Flavobacterium sp.]|nr:PAS domain-containing protein [Flavobacterium sp.]